MKTYRTNAILAGTLYIIGTVAGVLSVVVTGPVFDAPDSLARIAANPNQIIAGGLLVLTMGLALAMVPVVIFPILKKRSEVLAIGYVVFRGALETLTYIGTVVSFFLLASLSQAAGQPGAPDASYLQALGNLIRQAGEMSSTITEIVFPLGALMLYAALYRSRLIPRWLSVWGIIAVVTFMTSGFLHLFGVIGSMSPIQNLLAAPIFLQEMVMAVWLIVKGFEPSAVAAEPANAEVSLRRSQPNPA